MSFFVPFKIQSRMLNGMNALDICISVNMKWKYYITFMTCADADDAYAFGASSFHRIFLLLLTILLLSWCVFFSAFSEKPFVQYDEYDVKL